MQKVAINFKSFFLAQFGLISHENSTYKIYRMLDIISFNTITKQTFNCLLIYTSNFEIIVASNSFRNRKAQVVQLCSDIRLVKYWEKNRRIAHSKLHTL